MSRTQILSGLGDVTCTLAGTLYPVYGSSLFLKSFTLQAAVSNSGIVTVTDSAGNTMMELAAGIAVTYLGDNMDNGTAAKVDISTLKVKSTGAGDLVHVNASQGL